LTSGTLEDCVELAELKIRTTPNDTMKSIGMEMVIPFYKGYYVILPCRQEERYHNET